ncbi:MAG: hypothetical protein Q7R79_03730 [bacterium]|nr:hypothetical protein [bacterium]
MNQKKYFLFIFVGVIVLASVVAVTWYWFTQQKGLVEKKEVAPRVVKVESVPIMISDDGFVSSNSIIPLGSSVKFINSGKNDHWPASDNHPTHEIYPGFDPGKAIKPGESWTFTFSTPGAWHYHDHLNQTLRGIILVQ